MALLAEQVGEANVDKNRLEQEIIFYLEKYDILNNMAYGTEKHINAIKEYGITKFHRKTFGICKSYEINNI
mgnify:CR=1 FL=1